ncbi:MAG: thiamine pyrophosphate-binding protein [Deltaproteobacteria bacterium]|nr:thiamine pyrophosphate-binding protein [Deltaproteobacteria bacterium]
MKIRVADYIIENLVSLGIKDIFLLSGGGAMHLIDAVGRNKKIKYIANLHEQACGFAAEGYSRLKNSLAACIVTSGPGGTNALTPLINCWLDSVPVIFISGQVKLKDTIYSNPDLRQFGDQEINIIDMVKPVTKHAVMLTDKSQVRFEFEKALYLAQAGRPGPVWLDVPLDIQSAEFNPDKYAGFTVEKPGKSPDIAAIVSKVIEKLEKSKRPLITAGQGIRIAGAIKPFLDLIETINVPTVTSILAKDILPFNHPLCTGLPGIAGQRGANFACANCDLLISIGSRLMLRHIGFNYELFAREAYKIVVDIDGYEARKKSISADMPIECDAKVFIEELLRQVKKRGGIQKDHSPWRKRCAEWHKKYNTIEKQFENQGKLINSHLFMERFSELSSAGDIVVTANGSAYIAALQGYRVKTRQRLIYNKASAPMGFGLPAAIGACVANGRRPVYCFENDGSLQMNMQELQTIRHYKLPVKMAVFNNDGYLSIKLTQKSFFPDNLTACHPQSGVSAPSFKKICDAYGLPYMKLENKKDINKVIKEFISARGPVILEIFMDPWQEFLPKAATVIRRDGSMFTKPLEDMYPFLDRDTFRKNMIVKIINDKKDGAS